MDRRSLPHAAAQAEPHRGRPAGRNRRNRRALPVTLVLLGLASMLTFLASHSVGASPDVIHIVNMGDSYGAGNGARDANGNIVNEGPDRCKRRSTNWAGQYATKMAAEGYQVDYVTRACSAAQVPNITGPTNTLTYKTAKVLPGTPDAMKKAALNGPCKTEYPGDEVITATVVGPTTVECHTTMAPQIDAVTPDTDLVFMSFGGVDAGFVSIVADCFVLTTDNAAGCQAAVQKGASKLPDLQSGLTDAFAAVRKKSNGHAHVVLVGYPYLAQNIHTTLYGTKGGAVLKVDAPQLVRAFEDAGAVAQQNAIAAANQQAVADGGSPFVTYVDTRALFAGHEPSAVGIPSNPARWVIELADAKEFVEIYHYNPLGHTAVADLLVSQGTFGAS